VFSRETRKREPLFYDASYDNIRKIHVSIIGLGIFITYTSI